MTSIRRPALVGDEGRADRVRATLADLQEVLPPRGRLSGSPASDRAGNATRRLGELRRLLRRERAALAVVVSAVMVAVMFLLDFIGGGKDSLLEEADKQQGVAVALGEHIVVALLVATVAYWLLVQWKPRRALRKHRKRVRREEPERAVVRERRAELFAEGVADPRAAALGVVYGRTGTGRTAFLAMLRVELAKRRRVPVTVHASRKGLAELEDQALKAFAGDIEPYLESDEQNEVIWRRARLWRDIVVIVDEITEDVVAALWDDDGELLRREIKSLQSHGIALVLSTTRRLPLDGSVTIREDLDLFTLAEAERYVEKAIGEDKLQEVLDALHLLRDPIDESLVAPFYLEFLARLDAPLGHVSPNRDLWRAEILGRYIEATEQGSVSVRRELGATSEAKPSGDQRGAGGRMSSALVERAERGSAALKAAEALARVLPIERGRFSADPKILGKLPRRAVSCAVELGLMWHRGERIGFEADDLGAYLIGKRRERRKRLLDIVIRIAVQPMERGREDRYPVMALIFWALQHRAEADDLLAELLERTDHRARPLVVATAIRIAATCGISSHDRELGERARTCIAGVRTIGSKGPGAWKRDELIKLMRALAEWQTATAQELLLDLSRSGAAGLDWPAARALATSDALEQPVEKLVNHLLEQALRSGPDEVSKPDREQGRDVAALAWILPALREQCAEQFEAVRDLCMNPQMSPLRGQVAIAQGLKLAVINGRCAERNFEDILDLLTRTGERRDPYVRSWHARIVLVQATLAHIWLNVHDKDARARELLQRLSHLPERHELVQHAIRLVREGLRVTSDPAYKDKLDRFIWMHEKQVVRWVGVGRDELARLAADTVLLSNMSYALRDEDRQRADQVATQTDLPRCIRSSSRSQIIQGACDCGQGLCQPGRPPALERYAPFAESFCREQARLARRKGGPQWVRPRRRAGKRLEEFWAGQAQAIVRARPRG
jgi:hypothetical protein